jgi:two-component system sensor histidine kinase HupT/HoxJ
LTVRSSIEGDRLRVTFSDSGPGVPDRARGKLFDPFFTTKDAGRGSGLGLSVSYRIMQEHGGALLLDEDVTDGAAFVFELPRTDLS